MARPEVTSATATSATTIDVVFDQLMKHNSLLTSPSAYVTNGPTAITPISIVATDAAVTTATVTISGEMTTGASYDISVLYVENLASEVIADPPANGASFTGVGVAPQVVEVLPVEGSDACKVVFSEETMELVSAETPANYTIVRVPPAGPALSVDSVERTDNYETFLLSISPNMTAGDTYEVTVATPAVTDQALNPVDPLANTGQFIAAGTGTPAITITPANGATQIALRTKLIVNAVDDADDFSGIDSTTLWVRVTYENTIGTDVTEYVFQGGAVQTAAFAGGVLTGDEDDPDTGITWWATPKYGSWLPETSYYVEVYVEDKDFTGSMGLATFTTGAPDCYEDEEHTTTATDTALLASLEDYPNCRQLRELIFLNATNSSVDLVRTRTLLYLAAMTDHRAVLAGIVDLNLVDGIKLCDRQPVLGVYQKIAARRATYMRAIAELATLGVGTQAQQLLRDMFESNSPIYVVNGAALLVVLCAVLSAR